MMRTSIAALIVLAGVTAGSAQKKPPLPPNEWKGTEATESQSANLASDDPFGIVAHRAITPSGTACSNELNAAIYRQDILHAFESRAHFDNCAFDEAAQYVDELTAEAGRRFAAAGAVRAANEQPRKEILDGMLALGQALHAIQDFYAHSNYVELVQATEPRPEGQEDIPLVALWETRGRARLRQLQNGALRSGRVWWSLPHRCAANVPLHHDLAKDSRTTPAGARASIWSPVGRRTKIPNYIIAHNLAGRATREYLRWSAKRWPIIRSECGDTLKFVVQADRRNDPPEEK